MKKPRRKRCKAKTYNMILSLYIVVMILANANLVYGISDIHEDRVNEAELFRAASLKSLTTTFICQREGVPYRDHQARKLITIST